MRCELTPATEQLRVCYAKERELFAIKKALAEKQRVVADDAYQSVVRKQESLFGALRLGQGQVRAAE